MELYLAEKENGETTVVTVDEIQKMITGYISHEVLRDNADHEYVRVTRRATYSTFVYDNELEDGTLTISDLRFSRAVVKPCSWAINSKHVAVRNGVEFVNVNVWARYAMDNISDDENIAPVLGSL